ncbi:MAG: type IV pili twitching motility protein PilT, partial [Microgenomates group bacterium]
MAIKELLQLTIDRNASDLHIVAGIPPTLRVDGQLTPVPNEAVSTPDIIASYLKEILSSEQLERLNVNKELDFSLSFSDKARFRVNAYTQKGSFALAFRRIPLEIPQIDSLGLPKILHSFTGLRQGFI